MTINHLYLKYINFTGMYTIGNSVYMYEKSTIYLKILTNLTQIIGVLTSFKISIPKIITQFFDFLGNPVT